MKFSKKASLNLSVNAIVIFVLAFAMLGVGLFVTNMIKERIGKSIGNIGVGDLEATPDAQNPITFPSELQIGPGEEKTQNVGFYNKAKQGATSDETIARIVRCKANGVDVTDSDNDAYPVDDPLCIPTDGGDGTYDEAHCLPVVTSSVGEIKRADIGAFQVIIEEQGTLRSDTKYACTFEIVTPGTGGTNPDKVHESEQFIMYVTD